MTNLSAYLRLLIIVICYGISSPASADIYWHWNGNMHNPTPAGTCSQILMSIGGGHSAGIRQVSVYPGDGMPNAYACKRLLIPAPPPPAAQDEEFAFVNRNGSACTAPKVLNPNGTCDPEKTCAVGFKLVNGECVPELKKCSKDKWVVVQQGAGPPGDNRGCAITIIQLLKCYTGTGGNYCKWEVQQTGEASEGETPAPETPPPTDGPRIPSPPFPEPVPGKGCPTGTVQAGQSASGVPICVGTGTAPQTPPAAPGAGNSSGSTTSTTDPETGVKTETKVSNVKNSDGTTTTTTTTVTTNPDGSTQVDSRGETSLRPDGTSGISDEGKQEKGDFCKENPTLSVCRESSVSGSCGEISCEGDAITCALLRASAAMECRDKEAYDKMKDDPATALGGQIGTGQDPLKGDIDELIKGTEVDMSNPNLDSSGFLGGGSCLAPMVFSVGSQQVVYSFDTICSQIQPLRLLILSICTLFAYLVVARSVLGGT